MIFRLMLVSVVLGSVGLFWGAVDLPFRNLMFDGVTFDSSAQYVLWQLRVPRVLFAFLVGAVLAYCGSLSQGIFRNYLADPGLLGISSGSAAGAALALVILSSLELDLGFLQLWVLPLSSFLGGIGVCYLIEFIARRYLERHVAGLLLLGIGINAIVASWIGICTYIATDEQLRTLSFWTLGSLGSANWVFLSILFLIFTFFIRHSQRHAGSLNAIALGNDVALQMGVEVRQVRREVILSIALLQSVVIAWCGMISFIGLIAPNLARQCVGDDQIKLIPLATLIGGMILLGADLLAKNLVSPAEIPIGILTSLIGGPFFLYSLLRQK